jgi:hypothetical protein
MKGRCERHALVDGVEPVSYRSVLDLWQESEAFRAWFAGVLRDCPFSVYRWETPPVTRDTINRPFEFVLVASPGIDLPPDPEPFLDYFDSEGQGIVAFENLGRDALMVVPTPLADPSAYGHLAAFIRNAPAEQIDALWSKVAEAVGDRLGDQPLWLNTAGGGVAWLHVRLDSRPKYYEYESYKGLLETRIVE